jgi:hypothetical protein
VDQETACYIWQYGGKIVSATVWPARILINLALASTACA